MEIHLKQGESLTIFARSLDGLQKTFNISHLEMMARGETLIDGLTQREIEALQKSKKIQAIKLYRERTLEGLKDCKRRVEEWAARNHCCADWPRCEHLECIKFLDQTLLKVQKLLLAVHWTFAGKLSVQQCHALMTIHGYSALKFGFFSYNVEYSAKSDDSITRWSTNATPNEDDA